MTTNQAIVVGLAVASLVFEGLGLGLVVRSIVLDRRRAREILSRPFGQPLVARDRLGGLDAALIAAPSSPVTPGRFSQLERRVVDLELGVRDQAGEERERTEQRIASVVAGVTEWAQASDDELRAYLTEILAGEARSRVVGVVLVALGIALGAATNIAGTLLPT